MSRIIVEHTSRKTYENIAGHLKNFSGSTLVWMADSRRGDTRSRSLARQLGSSRGIAGTHGHFGVRQKPVWICMCYLIVLKFY